MNYIDIKKLTLDELVGVVSLYPWFGGARKELCERMSRMGGDGWGESQYADAALYIGSRSKLSDMMRSSRARDWTDADVEGLIKSYIAEKEVVEPAASSAPAYARKVHVVGGDYFSIEDYEQVRRSDDNVFSKYAAKARQDAPVQNGISAVEFDLYTETLAQIYAEQGYYEQAKHIYSKLILAYPEKNAYFAALIQKLNEIN
jgi:tetratricopeptide (TPR) repeat protein